MFNFFEKLFRFSKNSKGSRYKNMNSGITPIISSTTVDLTTPIQELSYDNTTENIIKLREIFGYQLADSVILDLLSHYKTVNNAANAYFDNSTYMSTV